MLVQKTFDLVSRSIFKRYLQNHLRHVHLSKMAAKYELCYFNSRSGGEGIRWIFAVAGVDFVDTRVSWFDYPKTMKAETPFGQLPMLKMAGEKPLCQTMAIAEFIARNHGLAGDEGVHRARVSMIMHCVQDVLIKYWDGFFCDDEERKTALTKTFEEEVLPDRYQKLNDLAEESYFVGNRLSAADIFFGVLAESRPADFDWTPYPRLKTIFDNVRANPGIQAWVKKRPHTDH